MQPVRLLCTYIMLTTICFDRGRDKKLKSLLRMPGVQSADLNVTDRRRGVLDARQSAVVDLYELFL